MTALYVIGGILLFFLLIALIPVGARVRYSERGFYLAARVSFVKLQLIPPREKKPKPEDKPAEKDEKPSEKPEKPSETTDKPETTEKPSETTETTERPSETSEKTEEAPGRELGGTVELLKTVLSSVFDALGKLRRKLTVNYLRLEYTAGCPDPAEAAMSYGAAVAAINAYMPALERYLRIKKRDFAVYVSFSGDGNRAFAEADITIRVWEIIYVALALLPALKAYLKWSKSGKGEKENG